MHSIARGAEQRRSVEGEGEGEGNGKSYYQEEVKRTLCLGHGLKSMPYGLSLLPAANATQPLLLLCTI